MYQNNWNMKKKRSCIFAHVHMNRHTNMPTGLLSPHAHTRTWKKAVSIKKRCLMLPSHPLCRKCFGQYQASSAVLEWAGDGDCYFVQGAQSGGRLYSHGCKCSVSLCSMYVRSSCSRAKHSQEHWLCKLSTAVWVPKVPPVAQLN